MSLTAPVIGSSELGIVGLVTADQQVTGAGGVGEQDMVANLYTEEDNRIGQFGGTGGRAYRLELAGEQTWIAGSGTFDIRLRFGGGLIVDYQTPNQAGAGGPAAFYVCAFIILTAYGAAGTFRAGGYIRSEMAAGAATQKAFDVSGVAIDTTAGAILKATGQFSVGNAGNIIVVRSGFAERLRA